MRGGSGNSLRWYTLKASPSSYTFGCSRCWAAVPLVSLVQTQGQSQKAPNDKTTRKTLRSPLELYPTVSLPRILILFLSAHTHTHARTHARTNNMPSACCHLLWSKLALTRDGNDGGGAVHRCSLLVPVWMTTAWAEVRMGKHALQIGLSRL